MDGIIRFNALGEAELSQVLAHLLAEEGALLAEQKTNLQVSESAQSWLLAQNTRSNWGARPLRRLVQEHIRAPSLPFCYSNRHKQKSR